MGGDVQRAGPGDEHVGVVEMPGRLLEPAQRSGTAPLPAVLPLGAELTGIFEPALAALSPDGRTAGIVLAASRTGQASHVATALERCGVAAAAALDEVERAGVVAREGDVLAFRHPLLRTAVWYAATPAERRAAHSALADAARSGDDATRLWHRSQAATGRDDALAGELVALAGTERARSGFAASSLLLERAADLTTDAATSADRLAAAVSDAFLSGDVGRTRALAARVLAEGGGAPSRAAALLALGRVEEHTGSIPAARDLLGEAAELAGGPLRTTALAEPVLHQGQLGDVGGLVRTAERMAAAADPGAEAQALTDWVRGAALTHIGEVEPGRALLRRARERMESDPSLRDEPRLLPFVLLALAFLGDVETAVPDVERRLRITRERGALGILVAVLSMTAFGRAELLGDHAGAFADAGEAVDLAAHLGYVADAAPAAELLAWEYAARGRHDEAEGAFEEALRWHAEALDGFETPHSRLLFGEWLRRAGQRTPARVQLEAAAEAFEGMDLTLWARRAEDELRATGRTARPRRPLLEEPLTPQETRIAALAAEGMANREIAGALFLSPKTVEHHLTTVYRKRGLRSRAQLAQLFPTSQAR